MSAKQPLAIEKVIAPGTRPSHKPTIAMTITGTICPTLAIGELIRLFGVSWWFSLFMIPAFIMMISPPIRMIWLERKLHKLQEKKQELTAQLKSLNPKFTLTNIDNVELTKWQKIEPHIAGMCSALGAFCGFGAVLFELPAALPFVITSPIFMFSIIALAVVVGALAAWAMYKIVKPSMQQLIKLVALKKLEIKELETTLAEQRKPAVKQKQPVQSQSKFNAIVTNALRKMHDKWDNRPIFRMQPKYNDNYNISKLKNTQ